MTIWINNPFDFLPGEGARLQRYGLLCRALSQAGHRVIWWSSDWSHIKKEKRTPRQGEAVPRRTPRQGEAVPGECANDPNEKPMYRCYHGIEKVAVGSTSRQLGQRTEVGGNCPLPLPTANLKLVYVGNMGRGYDLETLVRAVVELIDEGYPIDLDLAGSGEQEPLLKSLAGAKINAIRFHGVVMGDHLQELLGQSDLGVVPMFPSTVVAVPYKLADYVASGLPVVNSLPGETKALLEQFACGWQYEAGSVASLKQALKEIYDLKLRDGVAFDVCRNNAKRLAEECFDAERIYPAFVRWLEGLLRPHSGRNDVIKTGMTGSDRPHSGRNDVIKSNAFQTTFAAKGATA